MTNYKEQIIKKGYDVVHENSTGITFVSQDLQMCVMLVYNYDREDPGDAIYNLNETLKAYSFSNKGTLCVIVDSKDDREKTERDPYNYLKVFADKIDIIPTQINKTITVTFEAMLNMDDKADYNVDPFSEIDGLACTDYYRFLSSITSDCTVKCPKSIENHWFRYVTNKFFTIENNK